MCFSYNWFFSKHQLSTPEELSRDNHESNSSRMYHFEGSDLWIHGKVDDWEELAGYYWCSAQNGLGKSTSIKCVVVKGAGQQHTSRAPVSVRIRQSGPLRMGLAPVTKHDLPFTVFYSFKWNKNDQVSIIQVLLHLVEII